MDDLQFFNPYEDIRFTPIVSHTGSRKVRFTSLPFDSPTLYLIIYARNGNLNVKHGCTSIHNVGAEKSSANITTDFQVQSNAGSTPGMVLAF